MKRVLAAILICVAATALGGEAPPTVTFGYVDLYVDSGDAPLAAYQIDFSTLPENARIVGVEGGESAAFQQAPYFDPAARGGERVIIGAFSLAKDLPAGKTRVARIHLELTSGAPQQFDTKLVVSATAGGEKIPAKLTSVLQGGNP